jgi:hypothetical protein
LLLLLFLSSHTDTQNTYEHKVLSCLDFSHTFSCSDPSSSSVNNLLRYYILFNKMMFLWIIHTGTPLIWWTYLLITIDDAPTIQP